MTITVKGGWHGRTRRPERLAGRLRHDRRRHAGQPVREDWNKLTAAYVATRTFRERVLHDTSGEGTTGVDDRYAAAYFEGVGAEIWAPECSGSTHFLTSRTGRAGGATSHRFACQCSYSRTASSSRSKWPRRDVPLRSGDCAGGPRGGHRCRRREDVRLGGGASTVRESWSRSRRPVACRDLARSPRSRDQPVGRPPRVRGRLPGTRRDRRERHSHVTFARATVDARK